MRGFSFLVFAAVAVIGFTANSPKAQAQVNVEIGVAPACPYGYYDAAPYGCAPAGYYGPEWFNGDGFIGAGPWFHGSATFQGHVDNRLHPDHGYKGPAPKVGEKAEPEKQVKSANFKGNEVRDGRGHVAEKK
jgi:hypothetical protein